MMQLKNYIAGRLIDPKNNNWIDNFEPATGQVYSQIPNSDILDVDAAINAGLEAFPAWSGMQNAERAAILNKIADVIDAHAGGLALAESRDNGKPVSLAAKVDIPRASANFRHFAAAVQHFSSESHAMGREAINYTLRQPIGVVGCISPWNLPLYLFTWKIAPALAVGNCVVAKPSEITPMTAYLLSEICIEAGLPAGVLNIIHGLGASAGQALVSHPKIKAISFTGGTQTGKIIAAELAPKFKKVSLELGGKNPNIIFADCDYDKMLDTTVRSSFANQGQICLCGSRIIVERTIYDKFLADFVDRVNQLTVADPQTAEADQGALVSEAHMNKVLSYIKLAKEEGGTISAGGHQVHLKGRCKDGYFVAPTVITGLDMQCRTNQEEIFGPVVTITPFDTEEEALNLANATEYGLATSLWTENLTRAHRLAGRIETGIVWVNCWLKRDLRTPFGGMKHSGVGREGGEEALRFFTEPKNVCINIL